MQIALKVAKNLNKTLNKDINNSFIGSLVDANFGLTNKLVHEKTAAGYVNAASTNITKSNFKICKDYIFTLFNLFNFAIGVLLAIASSFSSLLFLVVVVLNITIGIAQEIKAKNLVKKLTVVSQSKVNVVREGSLSQIDVSNIVLDDIIEFSAGEQIVVDSTVLTGELEVNESLLTGESDTIIKRTGDKLFSGSFVVGGKARSKVDKVGADSYANRLAQSAKKHKEKSSQIVSSMRRITRITSLIIVPIGILLFVQALFFRDGGMVSWQEAIPPSAAALLGMLPRGLLLLVSIALSTAVIRLAKKRVLLQDLYASETL